MLLGPAHADHYRTKKRNYKERWYRDPLPADTIAPATKDIWPSFTTVKGAFGKNWEYTALGRVADWLEDNPHELDGLNRADRYERLKQMAKSKLNTAAARGTDVHKMFEDKLFGRITDDRFLTPEAREYRPAVDAFFDAYQPEPYAAEVVGIHRGLHDTGYGCTGDAIMRIQGSLVYPDYKSRKPDGEHDAYEEEVCQIGAVTGVEYIIIQGTNGPKRAPMPPLAGGLIISIRPDSFRVYPIDLAQAWLQFEELHAWWTRKLTAHNAVGDPWAPIGPVDLFALIATMDADRDAYEALYHAHEARWTPAATQAVKARLAAHSGPQTPHLTTVK